jgi:mxaJ protein
MTRRGSFLRALALLMVVGPCGLAFAGREPALPLRVCADPNNLPFSNDRFQGLENRLARLLAQDAGRPLRYTWSPQRRGFLRRTLYAHRCDIVMGVPAHLEMVDTTAPYYRSSYTFVTRRDRHLRLRSLDDTALQHLRIGVPLIGDDGANAPPAHGLARRGIVANVVGYSVHDDSARARPAILSAVIDGDVDVATIWGPVAGYFAARGPARLDVRPIAPSAVAPQFPVAFAIAMGVRRGDAARLAVLNRFLHRRAAEIDALLDAYHVPRLEPR